MKIKPPYPWFGGKSRVVDLVWSRFGDVRNFVEPFFGGGAMLLQRPGGPDFGTETINDADRFVANFWRATQADPEAVANWCDWPVNEADLHARHSWLVNHTADFRERMHADPDYYNAKIAGWWVWGLCQWIGSGWGESPHRKRPHLGNKGMGVHRPGSEIREQFALLQDRMRRVRVCCGDWSRVLTKTPTTHFGLTAVFLDPPYSAESDRCATLYTQEDLSVAHAVREWCLAHGDDPRLRVALCGYEGEHEALEDAGWSVVAWKTKGNYGSQGEGRGRANAGRERIWFSPHCVNPAADADMPLILNGAASC